jgi:hypothetical protein
MSSLKIITEVAGFLSYVGILGFAVWLHIKINDLRQTTSTEIKSRMAATTALMSRYASIYRELRELNERLRQDMSFGTSGDRAVPVDKIKAVLMTCDWVSRDEDGNLVAYDTYERKVAAKILNAAEYKDAAETIRIANWTGAEVPDLFHELLIQPSLDFLEIVEAGYSDQDVMEAAVEVARILENFRPIYTRFVDIDGGLYTSEALHPARRLPNFRMMLPAR